MMLSTSDNFSTLRKSISSKLTRSATILLTDRVENVFPLFGAIREKEWANGWDPDILYSNSEIEEYMVFRTKADNEDEDYYQWVVTKYDPLNFMIEYSISATERVWFVRVECRDCNNETLATITYTYISLSEKAHQRNRQGIEKIFFSDLADWEQLINHYLTTGKKHMN
jgi:hypothetical protein